MTAPTERGLIVSLAATKGWTVSPDSSTIVFTRAGKTLTVAFGITGSVVEARDGTRLLEGRDKASAVMRILRRRR